MIEHSARLFERLGCRDYARFDFRADAKGEIKLLEVNPNPGWCWDGKVNLMAGFSGHALLGTAGADPRRGGGAATIVGKPQRRRGAAGRGGPVTSPRVHRVTQWSALPPRSIVRSYWLSSLSLLALSRRYLA